MQRMTGRSRRLRVVLVAPSLQHMLGGQEVQGDQLVRSWAGDRAVEATLVPSNPSLPRPLRWLERIPVLRTVVRLPIRASALWHAMRHADVLHAFSGSYSSFMIATLPALLLARVRGIPALVHYHSPSGGTHLAESSVARWMLRQCPAVVVPSAYLRDQFATLGVQAVAIANVVDMPRFSWSREAPVEPLLLSVRNFERRYGVDDAIRAFATVKERCGFARLVLVGSGPEERSLRSLVKSLDLADVTFNGATSRDEVGQLMKGATILLNASRVDNMPVSILEAFAAGVAVVSTSAGGIPTFARHQHTALLSDVGDIEGLARHALALIDDSSLAQRLTTNAHQEVVEYTWATIRPRWLALYARIAAARTNSRQ